MIKADVKYDKAAYTGLMRYSVLSSPYKLVPYVVITVFLGILFLLYISSDAFLVFLAMFVFVLVIDVKVIFGYFIKPKIRLKKLTDDNIITNHFIFAEESILVTSKSKSKTSSSTVKYEWVIKACEDKNAFYLFVNKDGGLIITKKDIMNGSENQLRAFLCSKIPAKQNKLKNK